MFKLKRTSFLEKTGLFVLFSFKNQDFGQQSTSFVINTFVFRVSISTFKHTKKPFYLKRDARKNQSVSDRR